LFPQIFGKYILERPIAAGGMARVFLATLRGAGGFEKKLVVKQIRAELATDEAFVRRFVAEAKTTVELSHPNIVPVYELGVEQGVYYLAMELCDGVTLAELLQKTGKLAPEEGAYVGIEICRALDYAHRKARIIHRDVTPRNIIIDEEGAIRLIDFGIALPAYAGAKEVFGSPGHMPPEQLRGGELGPPTDVFAVAALLYEAWSKTAPFRRASREASERALFAPVAPLSTLERSLAPLDDLIASALFPDPSRRPQSTEELSRPLRRFLAEADLGDLARKLGARVVRLRAEARPADPSDANQAQAEALAASQVTRTFAIRPRDAQNGPLVGKKTELTPDPATRRMSDDAGRHAGRWVGGMLAVFGLTAVSGLLWRGAKPEPTVLTTPASSVMGGAIVNPTTKANVTDEAGPSAIADVQKGEPAPSSTIDRPASAVADDAPAHLRILANPQANVEVDGRPRGAAPIADLALAPGTHFVRLDCAPLGEAVSQNVRVAPGENLTISGDFTGAHGRILIRRSRATP